MHSGREQSYSHESANWALSELDDVPAVLDVDSVDVQPNRPVPPIVIGLQLPGTLHTPQPGDDDEQPTKSHPPLHHPQTTAPFTPPAKTKPEQPAKTFRSKLSSVSTYVSVPPPQEPLVEGWCLDSVFVHGSLKFHTNTNLPAEIFQTVGYPVYYAACLLLVAAPILLYFVFIPLAAPGKGFRPNWVYCFLQPMLSYGYISGGSAMCGSVGAFLCLGVRRGVVATWVGGFVFGGLFGIFSVALIDRFAGFYPLNALVSFLLHGSVVYEAIRRVVPKVWFPDLPEIKPLVAHMANVGNGYLGAIALSVGFLLAYYRVPSAAQIFLLVGFEALMAGVTLLMWDYCVKHQLHPGIYGTMWFSAAFIRDVFVLLAYPSTISPVTLTLLVISQALRASYGLFSLSQKWCELRVAFHRRLYPQKPEFVWTQRMMLMRLMHIALGSAGRLTATVVYVALAVGYRYGPNRDFLPFGQEDDTMFTRSLSFAAITAGVCVLQIVTNAVVLVRFYHLPVWDLLAEQGLKTGPWRWLTAWFALNAFVVVHLVIQSHANLLRLVRPSLYAG